MPITKLFPMTDKDKNDILAHIASLKTEVHECSYQIKTLAKEVVDLQAVSTHDHDEIMRLLVMRDFFWRIVIKIGLPLMFLMFGIGWGVGKFSQHISTVLGF